MRAKIKQAKNVKNHIRSERSRYIFKGNIEIGLDMQGQIVMTFTYENLVKLYPPDEDSLCLFATDTSGIDNVWWDRQYGYVDLTGRVIAEPEPFGNSNGPEYETGWPLSGWETGAGISMRKAGKSTSGMMLNDPLGYLL